MIPKKPSTKAIIFFHIANKYMNEMMVNAEFDIYFSPITFCLDGALMVKLLTVKGFSFHNRISYCSTEELLHGITDYN
jgi:hypothetical protein